MRPLPTTSDATCRRLTSITTWARLPTSSALVRLTVFEALGHGPAARENESRADGSAGRLPSISPISRPKPSSCAYAIIGFCTLQRPPCMRRPAGPNRVCEPDLRLLVLSDTGRPRVGGQLVPMAPLSGRAGARLTTRRTHAVKLRAEVGSCSVGSNRKAGASRGRFVAVRRHPQEEPASPSSAEDALRLGCRSAVSASTWTAAALAIPSERDSATNADDRAVAVRPIREN